VPFANVLRIIQAPNATGTGRQYHLHADDNQIEEILE
jgi:hypothetical protein